MKIAVTYVLQHENLFYLNMNFFCIHNIIEVGSHSYFRLLFCNSNRTLCIYDTTGYPE